MKQSRSSCNACMRIGFPLGMIVLIAASSLAVHALACGRSADKTPYGTIEFRYDIETGWFELWENGVLTTEWTATELGIEGVPDPEGWEQRFFWAAIDGVKPESVVKYVGKR